MSRLICGICRLKPATRYRRWIGKDNVPTCDPCNLANDGD